MADKFVSGINKLDWQQNKMCFSTDLLIFFGEFYESDAPVRGSSGQYGGIYKSGFYSIILLSGGDIRTF